ncbi:MAG: hypothetical protein QXY73_05505 [Candidatus Bathyarchaeia archaeon]
MIQEAEGNLAVTPESSDNPPVALKPLIIIIDLALHAKLIIPRLKRRWRDLDPEGWCRGRDLNPRPPDLLSFYAVSDPDFASS